MRGFALNLLLALVWALFAGEISLRELAVGYLVGFGILTLFPQALGTASYVRRSLAGLRFLWFFVRELTWANVQVALLALRPHPPLYPRIVAYPMRLRGDSPQTFFIAVLTLMPGSVAMGFNEDHTIVYIHIVGFDTAEGARQSIRKVEDVVLPLFAPSNLAGQAGKEYAGLRPTGTPGKERS